MFKAALRHDWIVTNFLSSRFSAGKRALGVILLVKRRQRSTLQATRRTYQEEGTLRAGADPSWPRPCRICPLITVEKCGFMLLLLANNFFIKVFSTESDDANWNSGAATTKEDGSTRTVNVGRTYNNRVRLPKAR